MARETYKYACGHGAGEVIGANRAEAERKAVWAEQNVYCAACKQKRAAEDRAKQSAKARKYANKLGLPDLTGSEAQVAWGETIRATILSQLDKVQASAVQQDRTAVDMQALRDFRQWLETHVTAKWWIEGQDYAGGRQKSANPIIALSAIIGGARTPTLDSYATMYGNRLKIAAKQEAQAERIAAYNAVFSVPLQSIKLWESRRGEVRLYLHHENGEQSVYHLTGNNFKIKPRSFESRLMREDATSECIEKVRCLLDARTEPAAK